MDEFYRVGLTSSEALAVTVAARALDTMCAQGAIDGGLEPGILASAANRIAAEMPDFLNGRAVQMSDALLQEMREAIGGFEDEAAGDLPPFPVRRTRRLIEDAQRRMLPVEIEYYVESRQEWTVREVEIHAVSEQNGIWYMTGHDHLRNEFRRFRLDHMRSVRIVIDETEDELFVDE